MYIKKVLIISLEKCFAYAEIKSFTGIGRSVRGTNGHVKSAAQPRGGGSPGWNISGIPSTTPLSTTPPVLQHSSTREGCARNSTDATKINNNQKGLSLWDPGPNKGHQWNYLGSSFWKFKIFKFSKISWFSILDREFRWCRCWSGPRLPTKSMPRDTRRSGIGPVPTVSIGYIFISTIL